ncbi:hypothetical protein PILCRDRAFT_706384 [Piloderma croceum F 1598]|uniref:Uncharacterized protein n=1 Tax=Piloderma croceum (strain F 1598) TaxID=765440 RepID=A0A0C3BAF1_PILCF|nr:hypothetical protein PILCRDRAFT_706384 [Piloderma croceum F 1598]
MIACGRQVSSRLSYNIDSILDSIGIMSSCFSSSTILHLSHCLVNELRMTTQLLSSSFNVCLVLMPIWHTSASIVLTSISFPYYISLPDCQPSNG